MSRPRLELPRRDFLKLAAAGLLRPEAWAFSAAAEFSARPQREPQEVAPRGKD